MAVSRVLRKRLQLEMSNYHEGKRRTVDALLVDDCISLPYKEIFQSNFTWDVAHDGCTVSSLQKNSIPQNLRTEYGSESGDRELYRFEDKYGRLEDCSVGYLGQQRATEMI